MTRLHRQSIFLVLSALFYLPSYAIAVGPPTVLTFDDVVTNGLNPVPMPAGYGGVSWPSNIAVWGINDPPMIAQSPPNRVLFNADFVIGGGTESLVTFIGGPVIFDGAYFSGYFDVYFNLYSGATLVGTSSILSLGDISNSNGSGPTFLASGYGGPVDTVGIFGNHDYITMDNFTFEAVPEPSTLLLLGIGAICLLDYRKTK